jgi:hypothetical protein
LNGAFDPKIRTLKREERKENRAKNAKNKLFLAIFAAFLSVLRGYALFANRAKK